MTLKNKDNVTGMNCLRATYSIYGNSDIENVNSIFYVAPRGIEPLSKVQETSILSVELQGRLGKVETKVAFFMISTN